MSASSVTRSLGGTRTGRSSGLLSRSSSLCLALAEPSWGLRLCRNSGLVGTSGGHWAIGVQGFRGSGGPTALGASGGHSWHHRAIGASGNLVLKLRQEQRTTDLGDLSAANNRRCPSAAHFVLPMCCQRSVLHNARNWPVASAGFLRVSLVGQLGARLTAVGLPRPSASGSRTSSIGPGQGRLLSSGRCGTDAGGGGACLVISGKRWPCQLVAKAPSDLSREPPQFERGGHAATHLPLPPQT